MYLPVSFLSVMEPQDLFLSFANKINGGKMSVDNFTRQSFPECL